MYVSAAKPTRAPVSNKIPTVEYSGGVTWQQAEAFNWYKLIFSPSSEMLQKFENRIQPQQMIKQLQGKRLLLKQAVSCFKKGEWSPLTSDATI